MFLGPKEDEFLAGCGHQLFGPFPAIKMGASRGGTCQGEEWRCIAHFAGLPSTGPSKFGKTASGWRKSGKSRKWRKEKIAGKFYWFFNYLLNFIFPHFQACFARRRVWLGGRRPQTDDLGHAQQQHHQAGPHRGRALGRGELPVVQPLLRVHPGHRLGR